MNPESEDDPTAVRVRRLISVSDIGKVIVPSPTKHTQTTVPAAGDQCRPANPQR